MYIMNPRSFLSNFWGSLHFDTPSCFGGLSAAWGQAGRPGSLPLRVAVVVSGWCSGLVPWVGALALAERVFSYLRTPVPRTPEF